MSYLISLECPHCEREFDPNQLQTFCPDCVEPLLARYDLYSVAASLDRDAIRARPRGMWRWQELLPVVKNEHIVTLGEGDTPLLAAPRLGEAVGLAHLYIKEEGVNPTGSFKARGLAAAISKAREVGVQRVIIPTAGNAGGAMAAYAARAGMQAAVYMPVDSPPATIAESRMAGAEVILVEGLISDAASLAASRARQESWFDLSTFKEPYRTEGKKIMGYELAESFGWELPEVILYPTGGGTGLVGMWKAFDEMERLGWLKKTDRPRMVSVQAEGCAPVVRAFQNRVERCEFWEGASTIALGLRVPKSFADRLILQLLRESGGTAVAVSDAHIEEAQRTIGRLEGLYASPEGAATYAALQALVGSGWIQPGERVVLFNTGAGTKYLAP